MVSYISIHVSATICFNCSVGHVDYHKSLISTAKTTTICPYSVSLRLIWPYYPIVQFIRGTEILEVILEYSPSINTSIITQPGTNSINSTCNGRTKYPGTV